MLLGGLQENLLVLLCFDADRAPIIRGVVDVALYGGPYRLIAARIYDYLDKFKKPPADHLPDIISDKLEAENKREAQLYIEIVEHLHAARENVNGDYAMAQLETYIKRQSLRSVAIDLAKALQRDTEASLEEAEQLLVQANHKGLSVFDPGLQLSDAKRALRFLDAKENSFPTGIPEFDRRGFGPTRKELWLLIANSSAGKSWGLTQLAKMAMVHRLRVLHITLENGEDMTSQRYFQTLFAMAKRSEGLLATRFQRDALGRYSGHDRVKVTPQLSLDDPQIRAKLEAKIKRWKYRLLQNLYIKEFPTGALTVNQLKAYMNNLEATQRFMPDLLIIDYPDLMKIPKEDYRLGLDEVNKDLRGLAVSRNLALAVVSQSHRGAAKAKQVRMDNVAEAYSKIAHADTVITYTQTEAERQLALARLHVAKGRNDADKFSVIISQNYGMGVFVVDSTMLTSTYWQNLPQNTEELSDDS